MVSLSRRDGKLLWFLWRKKAVTFAEIPQIFDIFDGNITQSAKNSCGNLLGKGLILRIFRNGKVTYHISSRLTAEHIKQLCSEVLPEDFDKINGIVDIFSVLESESDDKTE